MRVLTRRTARNTGGFLFGVALAIMIAVLSACAGNPTQAWLDTCDGYYEALRNTNDALELGIITKDSDVAKSMASADALLYPVCTGAAPPETADRESLQRSIDAILIEIIKAQKEKTS